MTPTIPTKAARSIQDRVAAGFDFLDGTLGKSWVHAIDVDHLDLGRAELCVIGQLYGGWGAGVDALVPPEDPPALTLPERDRTFFTRSRRLRPLGFYLDLERDQIGYRSLTRAWKARIIAAQHTRPRRMSKKLRELT